MDSLVSILHFKPFPTTEPNVISFVTDSQDVCLGTWEQAAGSGYPVIGRRATVSDLMGGYLLVGVADIKKYVLF